MKEKKHLGEERVTPFFSHVFSNIAVPRKRLSRQIKGKENIFSPKGKNRVKKEELVGKISLFFKKRGLIFKSSSGFLKSNFERLFEFLSFFSIFKKWGFYSKPAFFFLSLFWYFFSSVLQSNKILFLLTAILLICFLPFEKKNLRKGGVSFFFFIEKKKKELFWTIRFLCFKLVENKKNFTWINFFRKQNK